MTWRDYQQMQKVVQIGDRFVSYVDRGEGATVVLIHGIPTWGYMWEQQLAVLSETHRVLVPDLLGFGYSDKRDRFDRSIDRQAQMIDVWMDQLDIDSATIVAHDIGGGVALRLATLVPSRVNRLCVMNTICYDSWPIELMLQLGHPDADRKMSAPAMQTMLATALKQGFARAPSEEILSGLLSPYRTEVGKLSLIRNAAALNTNLTTEITEHLTKIRVPTLILWGEEDKFQLMKFGERLADDIPESKLVRIQNARHFVMIDQPAKVNAHLVDFCA